MECSKYKTFEIDVLKNNLITCCRNIYEVCPQKLSDVPCHLCTRTFEPLRGMNANSNLSRTPWMPQLPLREYFLRTLVFTPTLKVTERSYQRICMKLCFKIGKNSAFTIEMMLMALGDMCLDKP